MTQFETIYEEFKDKITDYEMAGIYESIDTENQNFLLPLLRKACSRFRRMCKKLYSFNDDFSCFDEELSLEEIDILTEWMIVFWLKPYVYNTDNLQNIMNTKDFQMYSSKNLLDGIRDTHREAEKRAQSLSNDYSIINMDFSKLVRK